MMLWWAMLSWLAFEDYRHLSVSVWGCTALFILAIIYGNISSTREMIIIYFILKTLNSIPYFNLKNSMGEADRYLLAMTKLLYTWDEWTSIVGISALPCLIGNIQHPFFLYYFLGSSLYLLCII